MESIKLKNFRCLEDTGEIQIKPLTFLVGSNSSGKSSFLNFFPLLKQSIGERRIGPFLWNGENIDLKDFKNVVRHGEDLLEVEFTLKNISVTRNIRLPQRNSEAIHDIRVCFSVCESENQFDAIKTVTIEADGFVYSYGKDINSAIKLAIKDSNSNCLKSDDLSDTIGLASNNSLLPGLFFIKDKKSVDDISENCIDRIRKLLKQQKVEKASDNLDISRAVMMLGYHLVDPKEKLAKYLESFFHCQFDDETLSELHLLNHYRYINVIIDSINVALLRLVKRMIYVGPLREATERYYRYMNLDIDEINPDGSNLAMFLHNLDQTDKARLNYWLERYLGFTISTQSDMGHVEILITERDKTQQNLVDVGFGYTQVLPILVNIWKSLYIDTTMYGDFENPNKIYQEHILAIEQPELHLHPRFQAKFAELLVSVVKAAKEEKKDIRFVIETHSEILLNKIGELIATGQLHQDDTNVVIFNALHEKLNKYVELATYSKDGYLQNWPIGFFSEDVD